MHKTKSLKSLLAGVALFLGAGLSIHADQYNGLTKPNPAKPMQVDSIQVTDLGNGTSLVDVVVEGIGWFAVFEDCQDNSLPCLSGWQRSTGQPTEVLYVVPTANYRGLFVNTANVHGWGGSPQ